MSHKIYVHLWIGLSTLQISSTFSGVGEAFSKIDIIFIAPRQGNGIGSLRSTMDASYSRPIQTGKDLEMGSFYIADNVQIYHFMFGNITSLFVTDSSYSVMFYVQYTKPTYLCMPAIQHSSLVCHTVPIATPTKHGTITIKDTYLATKPI